MSLSLNSTCECCYTGDIFSNKLWWDVVKTITVNAQYIIKVFCQESV